MVMGNSVFGCGLSNLLVTVSSRNGEDNSLEDPLLQDAEDQPEAAPPVVAITLPQLLKARELRRPLVIVSTGMLSQQLSGMVHHILSTRCGD